jgi:hypothetical protein
MTTANVASTTNPPIGPNISPGENSIPARSWNTVWAAIIGASIASSTGAVMSSAAAAPQQAHDARRPDCAGAYQDALSRRLLGKF